MMKFLDLLAMSVNNLRRRKLRTALTVLGVVIGTASIVVMVSLGIGLNQLTVEQIASYGSLTQVTVYSDAGYGGGGGSNKQEPNYMTDDTMKQFASMEYVTGVSPILEASVIMKQGVYEANVTIQGVTHQYMEQMPLGEGSLPKENGKDLQLIYGNVVRQQFSNAKTGDGYWKTGKMPDVDFMNQPMFVIFDTDAYYQSKNGATSGEGENKVKPPKKYIIPGAAVIAGGEDEWNQYSYNVYGDIDLLKAQLKKIFRKNPIPGQPTTKKGKAYPYFIYNQAIVNVDDMANVTTVQKAIADLGYQANSNMEWLEQSQKQMNMVQAVLGGIGAVSLFVAAIGIANTMMMSIYERTKEIGVIKVLGCDMHTIRDMFLIESGFIGLMGGVIGICFSFVVSLAMNHFLGGTGLMGMTGDLSRIPGWLALSAVGFAIFVGMAAGFFPALRAMKLSPLAAIRNE